METKNRHLRIRLTEQQLRLVVEVLIKEQRNKSALVRDALTRYIKENHKEIFNGVKKMQ